MPVAELPLLALASYRATRLAVIDTVLEAPRDALTRRLADKPWGPKVIEGLSCTWCTGVWISGAVYAAWAAVNPARRRRPLREHVIAALAVAGAQGLLHSWEGE